MAATTIAVDRRPHAAFRPTPRVLLGPGPSDVHPRVLAAMAMPLLGHLDPEFVALMDETQAAPPPRLPDRKPADDGGLGHRIGGDGGRGRQPDRAGRQDGRLRQRSLRRPDGRRRPAAPGPRSRRSSGLTARSSSPRMVRDAVRKVGPKLVGIVQAETSTGAWQPIEEIAAIAHEGGAMIAVDAVTSLAGVPVEGRRLGDRRDLLRHPEVPGMPARPGPGLVQRGGLGRHRQPQD